jgi:Fusaric acid resistance protein-like
VDSAYRSGARVGGTYQSGIARARGWLRAHDPSHAALRRAARAAVLMPLLLLVGDKLIANPTLALFLAFGTFAMLLLVDFGGSLLDRLRAQGLLGLACALLICLGTLASRSPVAAVLGMLAVAFAVLFIGVVSSVIASATTALLLAFILPVSVAAPASQILDRVAGWGLAAAVSMVAITVLWPAPAANPVRARALEACRALAARLRAEIAWVRGDGSEPEQAKHEAALAAAQTAVAALRDTFFATPYRPTGLASDARAVIRLVDELRWLDGVVLRAAPKVHPRIPHDGICKLKLAAAAVLERAADALGDRAADPAALPAARDELREALRALEQLTTSKLPDPQDPGGESDPPATAQQRVVSALDPSFRAQELSFVVDQIAANVEFAAAAGRRSWMARLVGRQPQGFTGALTSVRERALAHAESSSSWLHNSIRGAVALAMSVLVCELTTVQHGFWVVFGTLAVLRSNALSTGQNLVRALAGTTAGFVVGGVLVYLIGTSTGVLWAVLPFVVLFAGLAPATISFAAGQAAFTVTLLVLFNLLAPVGWRIGIVRVEDVAIGGAVSLAVGLLFWPRGAGSALGRALSRAYVDGVGYLAGAVAYGVGRCDGSGPKADAPRALAVQAAASARRLDDTFRGYLAERGAKTVPLAEVTSLVTGVAGVRLAADAVLDLWDGDGAHGGDRAAARRELLAATDHVSGWYTRFAASLTGVAPVPDPRDADLAADGRLVDAVARDLRDGDGHATATGVRVIWTGDHLDAVRRLEAALVEPARAAALAG